MGAGRETLSWLGRNPGVPNSEQILSGLTEISNQWWPVAVVWHVLLTAVAVDLFKGWRPSRRQAARLAVLPLVGVTVAAWAFGNPFNGLVFTGLAVALWALATRLGEVPVRRGPVWSTIAGLVMVAFGWVYPHFLAFGLPWSYLYAAPVGLVPCPTLSVLVGLALLGNGFGARAWSLVLGFAGQFYGLFGAVRLGVHMDFVLLAGSLALLAMTLTRSPKATDGPSHSGN
jgi:hypothetical protein